ncbi:hypothetical protein Leryth_025792 [Lithospermum erythrorhizon]|nr:hypothetical protein Leryth_025792 [Lithospermum erythrorhizon]
MDPGSAHGHSLPPPFRNFNLQQHQFHHNTEDEQLSGTSGLKRDRDELNIGIRDIRDIIRYYYDSILLLFDTDI